jgi:hypothetical protein
LLIQHRKVRKWLPLGGPVELEKAGKSPCRKTKEESDLDARAVCAVEEHHSIRWCSEAIQKLFSWKQAQFFKN